MATARRERLCRIMLEELNCRGPSASHRASLPHRGIARLARLARLIDRWPEQSTQILARALQALRVHVRPGDKLRPLFHSCR